MGSRSRQSPRSIEHETLLNVLIKAREEAQVSQRELSRRLGMANTFIGRIERNVRLLDVAEFTLIVQALDLDPVELYAEYVEALKKIQRKTTRSKKTQS